MQFTESNIAEMFGHEAAEDEAIDRLKSYYFKRKIYSQVANELPIRILVGHKGIGKSALFHLAMSEQIQEKKLTLLIKPDDIAGIGESESDFLKLIREWKIGISDIISRKVLTSFGLLQEGWQNKLNNFGGRFIVFFCKTRLILNISSILINQKYLLLVILLITGKYMSI